MRCCGRRVCIGLLPRRSCWPTRRFYPRALPLLAPADLPWVTAWTDGAGSHPASCRIARAAWAVHFGPGQRSLSGSVPGPQSAQRAELFAAVMAASVSAGPLLVVTDPQYVARGVQRLRGWLRPPEWKHAGLWHLLWAAAAQGGLSARWVPAHRDGPGPPLLSLVDWEGNAEAGRLVGVALAAAQPPPQLVATAAAAELAYSAAVAVGAAALEAQLAWAHAGVVDGPARFPRRRVRFQARPLPRAVGARPLWVREYHQLHGSGRGMVACARCGLGTQASRALQVGTRVCVARRRTFTPMTGELSSSRFLVGAAALRRPRGLPS